MIIAVHRRAIEEVYGPGSWTRLEPALHLYLSSLPTGRRAMILRLDDPAGSGLSGHHPAMPHSAPDMARLIRALAVVAEPRPEAVLLVGGPEVIPFFFVANPPTVIDDTDFDIPTDNPYGCLSDDPQRFGDPDLAIGRLAAGRDDGIDGILVQLERARSRRTPPTPTAGAFAVSNLDWTDATIAIARRMPTGPVIVESSPNYRLSSANRGDMEKAVLFFNLHGRPDRTYWFGGTPSNPNPVLDPATALSATLPGSTVFACNCFGANLTGRSSSDSIAMAMTRRGALVVIGATGHSFGAMERKPCDFSEQLALGFFERLGLGEPAGLALRNARHGYVADRLNGNTVDNRDYKTVMQFIFLGDPLI